MSDAKWVVLQAVADVPTAHILSGLLQTHGIACRIRSDSALLGEARVCEIMVEDTTLAKARKALNEAQFTDAELDFLATGHLSCDDAKE